VALVLGAALPAAGAPAPGPPAPLGYTTYGVPTVVCAPTDGRIDSISGLAYRGGAIWVQADRDSSLWRLDDRCRPVQRAALDAGRLVDTEDLAGTADGTLWIADTGGNRVRRTEPAVLKVPAGGGQLTRYQLRYPDGPHDAEALLVSPDGAQLVLVTKSSSGVSTVFTPAAPMHDGGTTPLQAVGAIRVSALAGRNAGPGAVLVTGAAVSPDGQHVVLRTYNEAWEYDAPDGRLAEALQGLPRKVALPETKQGEAVAYTPDGKALVVAGERLDKVYRISVDRPRYAPTASAPVVEPPRNNRSAVAAVLVGGAVVCLLLLVGAVVAERRRHRRPSTAAEDQVQLPALPRRR
jgi:hypothetical protein